MSTALLFPGQGSQRPGAGAPWQGTRGWSLVAQASQVLDRDVAHLLLTADAGELRATRDAQLATFVVSLLAWQGLVERGMGAQGRVVVAGHSLGELTALVAAGVLTVEAGLLLVGERGAAMQEAADAVPGTMTAVLGLDDERVIEVCAGVEGAWPANFNAPRHVVISGTVDGVVAAGLALKSAGARRLLPLPVGGAFHTPLMAPARERLDVVLGRTRYAPAALPVLSGVTARAYGSDPSGTRLADSDPAGILSRQLTAPVRWRELLESLPARGVDRLVELGPGGVLAGLATRTLPGVRVATVATPDDLAAL